MATPPAVDHPPRFTRPPAVPVPPTVFGMGFGLAGLATAWHVAAGFGLAPAALGTVLTAVAAVAWLVSAAVYLRRALGVRGAFARNLRDPATGPFAAVAVITPTLLAADGVVPYAPVLGAVLVDVFLVLTLVLGAWMTGTWMQGGLDVDRLHPGYFLPTVGGGFVASLCAAEVGQHLLAQVLFGWGLICWLILGSMIMGRLILRPPLPAALTPTMALEVAPAAIASLSWLALNGGRLDAVLAGLAGYGLLMVLAQLVLLPVYRRLRFSLGTWAFVFSWSAVASTALSWIHLGAPAGGRVYSYLVLAAITVLTGGIAARTVVALARRQLLGGAPAPAPTP